MTLKDKLLIYLYNKGNSIDEEIGVYKSYSRYHNCDSLEHYEYMRSMIRLEAWKEFLDELYGIIINVK